MTPSFLIKDILTDLCNRLLQVSETPKLDAQVLLSNVLDKPRSWILAYPNTSLSIEEKDQVEMLTALLEDGVPLPYVLGHWEFFGLDFTLTPDTLIPRPETELLVDHALDWLTKHPTRRFAADVGTGTGCIAVALTVHISNLRVISSDISFPALKVAQRNLHRHGVEKRVDLLQADLLGATQTTFDLICANPPYIPTKMLRTLKVYRREPDVALNGGQEGLDLIHKLLQQSMERLSHGGLLLMEIEANQGSAALALAQNTFQESRVHIQSDLAGRDRLLTVEKISD